MFKLVLDTQSAISSLIDFGAPREIIILAYKKLILLCGSSLSSGEFCRVVRYPRLEKRILKKYLTVRALEYEYDMLLSYYNTKGVEPGEIIPADRDDEEFIRIAIASGAQTIVSRDKHLLNLHHYESIEIIRPSEFMRVWRINNQEGYNDIWNRRTWEVWRR